VVCQKFADRLNATCPNDDKLEWQLRDIIHRHYSMNCRVRQRTWEGCAATGQKFSLKTLTSDMFQPVKRDRIILCWDCFSCSEISTVIQPKTSLFWNVSTFFSKRTGGKKLYWEKPQRNVHKRFGRLSLLLSVIRPSTSLIPTWYGWYCISKGVVRAKLTRPQCFNVFKATFYLPFLNLPPLNHRHSQGGAKGPCPPKMFGKYSHFVLWKAFFQTK